MPTPRLILALLVFAAVIVRDPGQLRVAAPRDEATPVRASWVNRLKTNLGRVCDAQRLRPTAALVRTHDSEFVPSPPVVKYGTQTIGLLESRLPPPILS